MNMTLRRLIVSLLFLAPALSACGGGGETSETSAGRTTAQTTGVAQTTGGAATTSPGTVTGTSGGTTGPETVMTTSGGTTVETTAPTVETTAPTEETVQTTTTGEAPVIVSDPPLTATVGVTYTYDAEATGTEPLTWSLLTAPEGMTVDSATGLVTWTPTPDQVSKGGADAHDVTLKVENAFGEDTQAFSITVLPSGAPEIVSTPPTTARVGEEYRYEAAATGNEPILWSLLAGPEGMILEPDTGVLLWTPAENQVGTHPVSIQAENDVGSDRQDFEIEVAGRPPAITSEPETLALQGIPYLYEPSAEGTPPILWSLREGPEGMTIDSETGKVEWTPDTLGDFPVTIAAVNDFGEDTQSYTVMVKEPVPIIVSEPPLVAYFDRLYEYQAEAIGQPPITWSLLQGPEGMTIDPETGKVEWTPQGFEQTLVDVEIEARNDLGTDTQAFQIEVRACEPQIVSTPVTEGAVGVMYTYQAEAIGLPPITWRLVEAPEGMTVDPETGLVEWVPEQGGIFDVQLLAENECGASPQFFAIEVLEPPMIETTPLTAAVVGGPYRYAAGARGSEPITWTLVEGPEGMTISETEGLVTWIPAEDQVGVFDVTIRAENDAGADEQSFSVEVIAEVSVSETESEVLLSTDCLPYNGFSTLTVTAIPRDDRGAMLPPGLDVSIGKTGGGTFVTETEDRGDGTYTRVLQAGTEEFAAQIRVSITAEGVTTDLPAVPVSSAPPADPKGGTGGCPLQGQVSVTVIDARNGFPIEEAFVMIGDAIDDPFPGNIAFTDDAGHAILSHPDLTGPYKLTVAAEGFVFFTLDGAEAGDVVISLRPLIRGFIPQAKLQGNVTGATLPSLPTDLYAAFGVERFDIDSLMTFDFAEVVLNNFKTVTIAGVTIDIPENVAIPPGQIYPTIDYFVTILEPPKTTDIFAIGGSFTAQEMLNLLNSSPSLSKFVFGMLGIIHEDKAGIRRNINVQGDLSGQNVSLTHELIETMTIKVKNHLGNGLETVTFPVMYDDEGTRFYPTDFEPVCHPGQSNCNDTNGTVTVHTTTVDDTGVYSNLRYGAVVTTADLDNSKNEKTVILKRNAERNGTVTFDDFLRPTASMRESNDVFTFESAKNEEISPPSPDPSFYDAEILKIEVLENPDTGSNELVNNLMWIIRMPGDRVRFELPRLPTPEEAGGPVPDPIPSGGEAYLWRMRASALTEGEPFDFNDYAFDSYRLRVTHTSLNAISFFH